MQNEQITIDPIKLVAVKGNEEIDLSLTELRVLAVFIANKGKVLTNKAIHAAMQSSGDGKFTNIVSVYIRYLRQKIGQEAITTVRGQGYVFGEVGA